MTDIRATMGVYQVQHIEGDLPKRQPTCQKDKYSCAALSVPLRPTLSGSCLVSSGFSRAE